MSEKTLTFGTHIALCSHLVLTSSTNFDIMDCNSFWKIHFNYFQDIHFNKLLTISVAVEQKRIIKG